MTDTKVIVLGMDGLDPNLLEQFAKDGDMPHFRKLMDEETFSRLGTTNPPQSSVAWSTFATGANPGKHGVFDFIWRDPQNYGLSLSLTETEAPRTVDIGNVRIPVGVPKIKPRRKGEPFWETLRKRNIHATIVNLPNTFPTEKLEGRMLSGMGTPDIRGTQGTFSFYTSEPVDHSKEVGGKVYEVKFNSPTVNARLYGPIEMTARGIKEHSIPLNLEVLKDEKSLKIKLPEKEFTLKEGGWSDWIEVKFPVNWFKKIDGIVRFHVNQVSPLKLYVSPVNFDPNKPAMPISYPNNYAKEIAHEIGLYHTLGMPHDTWALNEGRIDDLTFLEQAKTIQSEKEGILKKELGRFKSGLLIMYFGSSDILSHMFWRAVDKKHPLYNDQEAKMFGNVIRRYYKRMDEVVGEIMKSLDDKTVLLILSDHGFNTFRRAVHVNAWLRDQGFLVLKDNTQKEGRELLADVDWSKTRAYSVGFGGIYINQIGREKEGIVSPGPESEKLRDELIQKLAGFKDPLTQHPVVKHIYKKEEVFWGPYAEIGPDLFIGFDAGYRSSWQTALGAVPAITMENNLKKWSGDHLCDPSLVPGVFLVNRNVRINNPAMVDMAPTILALFGIAKPEEMDGKALNLEEQKVNVAS